MDYRIHHWIIVLFMFCLFSSAWTQHNVIRFSTEETKEIVTIHNNVRRSVYNAANMRELTWNEAVAIAASEWGSQCEYISRPDNQWGQNMNYYHGKDYHNSSMDLFRDSIYAWANETQHYDYRRYRYCGGSNVCSYVQLIAADVQEVGCAIVKCPKLELRAPSDVQRHTKLLVCFYTPWVNILGSEVFIPDKRCAACPAGTSCVDNLCSARFHQPGTRTLPMGQNSVKIESISGSRRNEVPSTKKSREERRRARKEREEKKRRRTNQIIDSSTSVGLQIFEETQEHRRNPESYAIRSDNDTIVVYTPNNRVVPFPGKKEKRVIRKIEKFESKEEKDLDKKQEKLIHQLELVANNITVINSTTREGHSRSELTGEEQFFTISAHNLLRREAGVKDLAWSSHLERWAKYVIRCETEYPGPITCYTNFGKTNMDQEIYNVVYQWGSEGNDMNRPLRYGCRTPYDKSLCNHNTVITESALRLMACASKRCGFQRQLTCIYSSG